jgi:hypothetical protein
MRAMGLSMPATVKCADQRSSSLGLSLKRDTICVFLGTEAQKLCRYLNSKTKKGHALF